MMIAYQTTIKRNERFHFNFDFAGGHIAWEVHSSFLVVFICASEHLNDNLFGCNDWCYDWSGWNVFRYDCVEAVDWIRVVVDSSSGTVWFNERVRSLNYVTVAGFFLGFRVSGQVILNVVCVTVLWVRVNFFGGYHLWGNGDCAGGQDRCSGNGASRDDGWRWGSYDWSGGGILHWGD